MDLLEKFDDSMSSSPATWRQTVSTFVTDRKKAREDVKNDIKRRRVEQETESHSKLSDKAPMTEDEYVTFKSSRNRFISDDEYRAQFKSLVDMNGSCNTDPNGPDMIIVETKSAVRELHTFSKIQEVDRTEGISVATADQFSANVDLNMRTMAAPASMPIRRRLTTKTARGEGDSSSLPRLTAAALQDLETASNASSVAVAPTQVTAKPTDVGEEESTPPKQAVLKPAANALEVELEELEALELRKKLSGLQFQRAQKTFKKAISAFRAPLDGKAGAAKEF